MTDEDPTPQIYWAPPGYPPPGGPPQSSYPQSSYSQPTYPPTSYPPTPYPPTTYPQPGTQPWAQPSSAQPYWGQFAPSTAPSQPTASARSRRKRRAWLAGAAAVALAVAGGVFVAVGDHSGSAHPSAHLSVPKSFGTRVLNEERSAQGAAQLRTQLNGYPVLKAAYAHAVIGLYDQPNSPAGAVFFVGLDGHDIAPPSVLSSADARERFLDEYMDSDVVTDIDDFDPGPMGGSLRCGTVRGKLAECGWLDENTAGFAEINSTSSLDGAAQTTLELRAAAEH